MVGGRVVFRNLANFTASQNCILLPLQIAENLLANLISGAVRKNNFANTETPHHIADFDGVDVGFHSRDPNPHGGIDGEVLAPNYYLVFGELIAGYRWDMLHLESSTVSLWVIRSWNLGQPDLGIKIYLRILRHYIINYVNHYELPSQAR